MTEQPIYKDGDAVYSEQELLRYIAGELPAAAQHALERKMESDPGLKAAIEGLQVLQSKEELGALSQQLKQHLKHQVAQRKSRHRTFIRSRWWVWLAALILILLVFIAFAYYQLLTA